MTDIALGVPVEVLNIIINKSRSCPVGITLTGNDKPSVSSTAPMPITSELRPGDIIVSIGPRRVAAKGAIATARKMRAARHLEVEVWRPVRLAQQSLHS